MDSDAIKAFKAYSEDLAKTWQDQELFTVRVLDGFERLCIGGKLGSDLKIKVGEKDDESLYGIARCHIRANIETIYEYAESPIEIMFLCSFLLLCTYAISPFRLTITRPIVADAPTNGLRQAYQQQQAIRRDLQRSGRTSPDLEDLAKTLKGILGLREAAISLLNKQMETIGERLLDKAARNYLADYLPQSLYISLQPTFQNIQIGQTSIRPDMFVWKPSMPDLKLIVECDGYEYHSDKKAFSKDRVRDRILQQQEYQVFRFSGQEIFHDSMLKVYEFGDYLLNLEKQYRFEDGEKQANQSSQERASEQGKRKPSPQQKKRLRHEKRKRK